MSTSVAGMDAYPSSVDDGSHTEPPEAVKPRDPFTGPLETVAPWNFTLIACLMFAVTSLSLAENSTVMLVTYKFKQLRQPLNYIIVNLSVADFCLSLIGGTISFLTNARGYFFLGRWACVLEGFAVTFFGESEFQRCYGDEVTCVFRMCSKLSLSSTWGIFLRRKV